MPSDDDAYEDASDSDDASFSQPSTVEAEAVPAVPQEAQIKRVTSAFMYYQKSVMTQVKEELMSERPGEQINVGDIASKVSTMWKSLDSGQRKPFEAMNRADRERFNNESFLRDQEYARLQQEKRDNRNNLTDGDTTKRAGRQEQDAKRVILEQKRAKREAARALRPETEEEKQRKKEAADLRAKKNKEEKAVKARHAELRKSEKQDAKKRLEYLVAQSDVFRRLNMGKGSASGANESDKMPGPPSPSKRRTASFAEDPNAADFDEDEADDAVVLRKQPNCIKFGNLKDYQLEGLNWMIHLRSKLAQGLNGILADEMGLGKTLQSISILAYGWESLKINGPHLICVPKSTLSNWMNELARWCPSLRAVRFHGPKDERALFVEKYFNNMAAADSNMRPDMTLPDGSDDHSHSHRKFDVVVTTYEIANMEKKALAKFSWEYLVIDEAHRLKNEASMFATTVRGFHTKNRLLLTGTPLQNNLHELWALLNFLLPDIFSSADQFDDWFNLDVDDDSAKKDMIGTLHKILRPFMLRRLKSDVAKGLPPKTETLLMVGMSAMQKELYKKLLLRDIDSLSSKGETGRTAVLNIIMQLRKACGHPYLFEGMEDRTLHPLGEHLVENCGKMVLLDKLLKKLKEKGHRVLIFTQMTRVLDILEDFMHMRQYQYCRIDGNTDYESRESQIDVYNQPNSEKFCFLLSTRAGGLGINLQTADTVVLFDSDWNPQADLQAQDRAHRIGQKNPVSIYRLVTENTVEEKIVERAQQKLKLDAMVVQSGRLKEKDKVSKDEMMAAVKFGADQVFRSTDSAISDEDIDAILARGEERTKAMAAKLEKAEKGDLLNFSFDTGLKTQEFEGVDYSDKQFRDNLKLMAASAIGKRERKQAPNPNGPDGSKPREQTVVKPKKTLSFRGHQIHIPRHMRLPRMEPHMLFDMKRLCILNDMETEAFGALRDQGVMPNKETLDKLDSILPMEMAQEKKRLLSLGFPMLTKRDYFRFIRGLATKGRENLDDVAAEMGMSMEIVKPYAARFWEEGERLLGPKEWERVQRQIVKGSENLKQQHVLTQQLKEFMAEYENPRDEMVFGRGTEMYGEMDRSLIYSTNKHGYGNWDAIRRDILKDDKLVFNHTLQAITEREMTKRVDYRLKGIERDLNNARAAKKKSDFEAHLNMVKIHEEVARRANSTKTELAASKNPLNLDPMLFGKVNDMQAAQAKQEALWKSELEKINKAVELQMGRAEEARAAILRGDTNVNLQSISLKLGKSDLGTESALPALPRMRTDTSAAAVGVGGKKRGGGGPKRVKVQIPESMYGELAQAIGILGMNARDAVESGFVSRHPEINIKEVKDLFGKMAQRKKPSFLPNHEKPGNSRSKSWFYLRPHFYQLASDVDKAKYPGWEAAKAADDILFQEEITAKENKVKASRDKEKEKKRLKREANGQPPAKRGRKSKKDIAAEAAAAKLMAEQQQQAGAGVVAGIVAGAGVVAGTVAGVAGVAATLPPPPSVGGGGNGGEVLTPQPPSADSGSNGVAMDTTA
ncbi:hypothetical protein TrST_g9056 [Triparma strigata]|uniref:Uncharacterized protein n=1 Tax=Triparma strigata TaxID=1606541 RepID=A0A9W6ZLH7_9STRA|nr:hypothetical protein TrST_g9056 [Triparma strigata]